MRTKYHMTLKRRGKKSWRKKNRKPKLRYCISARLKGGISTTHCTYARSLRRTGRRAGRGGWTPGSTSRGSLPRCQLRQPWAPARPDSTSRSSYQVTHLKKIYHTVNRLRSFLSLGHSVTRSLGHLASPVIQSNLFHNFFNICYELTN